MQIVRQSILLGIFAVLLSSCAIFHFFQPAVQNKILDIADTKRLVQLGDPLTGINTAAKDFSVGVNSQNVPYVVYYTTNNSLQLYYYDKGTQKWTLSSTTAAFSGGYNAILNFISDSPYVAFKDSSQWGRIYTFGSPTASPLFANAFTVGSYFFSYTTTPSGFHYIAYTTNIMGSNTVELFDNSAGSFQKNFSFSGVRSMNTVDNLDIKSDRDNNIFVLAQFNSNAVMCKFDTGNTLTKYPFDGDMMGISFAIDGGNNLYYFYHHYDMAYIFKAYYDVRGTGNPSIDSYYARELLTNGGVMFGQQTVAASKNAPYYCYCFTLQVFPADTNISIFRVAPDGAFKNICLVYSNFSLMNDINLRMTVAPDGTLYMGSIRSNAQNGLHLIISKME